MAERNKVLIYRLGSLGDTVVALPCFHLLAEAFANRERILLTNYPVHAKAPAAEAVLRNTGIIQRYMSYPMATRNLIELAQLCWKLRRLKIETMVYLIPFRGEAAVRRDELFFRLCGIRNIIGIPRGDLKTRRYDPVTDRYEAEACRLARCIAQIGDAHPNDPSSWDLHLSDEEHARAINDLRPLNGAPFLAVGVGSKQEVKDWGVENWKALMPKLRRDFPEHTLVFIGAKEDRLAADEVATEWQGKSYNMNGNLSPRESAAVIQRADLLLSLDSGPMHLAASVGTPCVAIFSARTSPGVWFPYGDAHEVIYHKTHCFDCGLDVCRLEKKKCILSISPDEVSAAALRVRQRTRAQSRRHSDSLSAGSTPTEKQSELFRAF